MDISKNTLWAVLVVLSIVGLAVLCFWTYYIANIEPTSEWYPFKKTILIVLIAFDEAFVIIIGIFIFIMVMDLNIKTYEIKTKDTKIVELEADLERVRRGEKL